MHGNKEQAAHTQKKLVNRMPKKRLPDKQALIYALLLVVLIFVVFLPCLSLEFVDWDDPVNLLENEHLKVFADQWNWQAVKGIFTTDVCGNYNPLPILTFAIEKYFFAPEVIAHPFIFHFDNLWMHIACTLCVFVIFIKLRAGNTAAFIGALLFGIHPMRVESVAWVTERKDVLYGLFYLLAIITYFKYIRSENAAKWYAFTIALSVFSYFAKVQAVTLPVAMVAIDFYLGRKWASPKILILEKMPWWLLSFTFGMVNLYFIKNGVYDTSEPIFHYSFIDKIAVGAYTYLVYLVKWVYPYEMVHYYASPAKLPFVAYMALLAVPVGSVLLYIWARRKRLNYLLFGWAFFTVNVIFLLQVFPVGKAFLADRFTYIAYFGLFFIFIHIYQQAIAKYPAFKKTIHLGLGIYLSGLCLLTYTQAKTWQNTETLWTNYKSKNPDDYYGYHQLGNYYLAKATTEDANPAQREQLLQLALQNLTEANIKDSLSKRPSAKASAAVFDNLGIAYGVMGDHESALYFFTREINATPDSIDGYTNRSFEYFSHKQYGPAIKDYTQMIRLNPGNAYSYYSRANAYFSIGNYNAAIADLDKAISLNPKEPKFYIARAMAYRAINNIEASVKDAQYAKQLGGDVPENLLR